MRTRMFVARVTGNASLFSQSRTLSHSSYAANYNINNNDNDNLHSISRLEKLIQSRFESGTLGVDEALGYFNSMIRMRPMPSVGAFNNLLRALFKKNQFFTVLSLYREMLMNMDLNVMCSCRVDSLPDMTTLGIVINCLRRLGEPDLGFSILATVIKRGLRPDSHTLNTLLHGLCTKGAMAEAMELLREILGRWGGCDGVTYSTMINGFCKVGETRKAVEFLMIVCENGRIKPIVNCYNPIIDSLCKEGWVDDALSMFQVMINHGVVPDLICYNSLIHGLSRFGRWNEVNSFVNDMLVRGILPDVHTYTALIDSLCKEDKIREAFSLFGLMTKKGIKPTVVTFTSLISVLCKFGQWEEATQCLENMTSCRISPNIVTFTAMLDALCKEGRTEEALYLVEEMRKRGLEADADSVLCRILMGLNQRRLVADCIT